MFVPFTPVGKAIEAKAIALKQRVALPWYEPVDPVAMLALVPATLWLEADFRQIDHILADALFVRGANDWSAFAVVDEANDRLPTIVLNSRHPETRRRASLMEEIVHLMLRHPPSRLVATRSGVSITRTHDERVELEAYDVGSACLVPYRPLFQAIRYDGVPADVLATRFGVSGDLIRYRIKRAGLSAVYRKRCG
jgi:hypothetical protein